MFGLAKRCGTVETLTTGSPPKKRNITAPIPRRRYQYHLPLSRCLHSTVTPIGGRLRRRQPQQALRRNFGAFILSRTVSETGGPRTITPTPAVDESIATGVTTSRLNSSIMYGEKEGPYSEGRKEEPERPSGNRAKPPSIRADTVLTEMCHL